MYVSVDDLRKKWRGLRDTFGRELKKITKTKSGQSANTDVVSKWPYFSILLFLKDTMSRRNLTGNVPIRDDSDTEGTQLENTTVPDDSPVSPVPSSSNTSSMAHIPEQTPVKNLNPPPKKKFRKQRSDEIDEKLLQIEEQKLKYWQESVNDSDAQFLMSLLPFLKDLPQRRKLIVRAKIQQVLIDEQNALSTPQYDFSSDSSQISAHQSTIPQQQLPNEDAGLPNLTNFILNFTPQNCNP